MYLSTLTFFSLFKCFLSRIGINTWVVLWENQGKKLGNVFSPERLPLECCANIELWRLSKNNYHPFISLLSLSFTIFCPREASIRGKIREKKLADVFFPQNCRVVLKILSISYLSFSHSLLLFLSKIGTNTWDEVVGKSDGKRTNV